MRLYGTNVVDGTDLGTAARHPEYFAGANDIITNLPMERETGVEINRTHVIFDYYLFYRNNIFLRLYSNISFLDTVVQLTKWKMSFNSGKMGDKISWKTNLLRVASLGVSVYCSIALWFIKRQCYKPVVFNVKHQGGHMVASSTSR